MTKDTLISDVILRLTAGKPSDDFEIEKSQVAFWIDQVLNSVVKQSLDAKLKSGEGIDPVYLYPQYNADVVYDVRNGLDTFYIDLDFEPMNLYRDGGMVRVANSDLSGLVDRVNIAELDTTMNLKVSKPSLKNIKYSRRQSRLYLYGLDVNSYAMNNFDLVYVPLTKVLDLLKPTDNIYVAEDLVPIIAEAVAQLGRQELSGINDIENDNVETPQRANNNEQ